MKTKLLPILIANLFAVSGTAVAQDSGFKWTGSVGVGGMINNVDSRDASKFNEYRDMSDGFSGAFDLRGRSNAFYLDAFGENIGRDDQYLFLNGGMFGQFKGRLYGDWVPHNYGWGPDGARTPYVNPGSNSLTLFAQPATLTTPGFNAAAAQLANSNVPPWTSFDYKTDRRDVGGFIEYAGMSPWYIRFDANQVTQSGINKADAAALGTSPGNGFIDLAYPVEYKTRNYMVEGGYQSPRAHASVSYTYSQFSNDNSLLNFQNPFFGWGTDTATFAPDNDYTRVAANGMLRQLPLNSTLSGRVVWSKVTNSANVLGSVLNTANSPAFTGTFPTSSTFDGKAENTVVQLSLASLPTRALDTRVYYNYYDRDNSSSQITFQTLTSGLACNGQSQVPAGTPTPEQCVNEVESYKKNNAGFEVGYRLTPGNRLSGGVDYLNVNYDGRPDADEASTWRFWGQWSSTSFESLTMRFKYQYLQRRTDFLTDNAGFNANDPFYLERFARAYDVANLNQQLFRAYVDWSPLPLLDLGLEWTYKYNDYPDTTLGRQDDKRNELYGSVSYGDPSKFRVTLFGDIEYINYDSNHRTVNASPCNAATGPNCFDPNRPPNSAAFNWGGDVSVKNWMVGLGADWPVMERLTLKASGIIGETGGSVDFNPQLLANGLPAATLFRISTYDNTQTRSLVLRGVYLLTKNWELTAGYSYEKYSYKDAQFDGYQYTVGTGTTTSYLSGIYAFQDYTANIFYGMVRYRF